MLHKHILLDMQYRGVYNAKVNELLKLFNSFCNFSSFLSWFIILIMPLIIKDHGSNTFSDCGTSDFL